MSQTSLGAPASEKSTHVEEAILESRYGHPHRCQLSCPADGALPSAWCLRRGRGWSRAWAAMLVQVNGLMSGKCRCRCLTGMPHAGCSPRDKFGFFPTAAWGACGSWGIRLLLPSVSYLLCLPSCTPELTCSAWCRPAAQCSGPRLWWWWLQGTWVASLSAARMAIPGQPHVPQLSVVAVLAVTVHHPLTPLAPTLPQAPFVSGCWYVLPSKVLWATLRLSCYPGRQF